MNIRKDITLRPKMKKLFIVLLVLPINMYGMKCQEMVSVEQVSVSAIFADKELFKNTLGVLEKVPDMDRLLAQYLLKDYPTIVAYLLSKVTISCEILENAPRITKVKCGLSFVTESSGCGKQTMKISDRETGAYISTIETDKIHLFKVTAAEDKLVTWSDCNAYKLNVWDVQSGELFISFEYKDIDLKGALFLKFNKKGDQLVTISTNTVKIWGIQTGECLHTFVHDEDVYLVRFNKKGDKIVIVPYEKTAKIWDLNTGDCLHTLKGHTNQVTKAVFDRTGNKIVTGSWDKTAKVWDVKTGVCLFTFGDDTYSIDSVYFNDEGKVITIKKDRPMKAWDINIPREVEEFLTKKIVCMQAYILYVVYETMITRMLIKNREKNGSVEEEIVQEQDIGTLGGWLSGVVSIFFNDEEVEVVYPALNDITVDFNKCHDLEQYYTSMPKAIQDILAQYVVLRTT